MGSARRGCLGHLVRGWQRPHGHRSLGGPGSCGPARWARALSPGGSRRPGPARPAHNAGGAEAQPAGTPPQAGGAGARRAARDSTEPLGTSDLRSPGRPGPLRGPADNRAGTAGLVPGFLHCPAATRPLPGLAALSRGRSREGQGAAGPGTQVPGRARHRGR